MRDLNLPPPIAAYFEADREGGEAVAGCFTRSAVVKDEGQTYVGRTAIAAWKTEASSRFSYVSEPVDVQRQDERYLVTSRVTGTFPGSPVDLRLSFRLDRDRIAQLEITP